MRRLKPTTLNLDSATRDRIAALVERQRRDALDEGEDLPTASTTLRTALRRGLASIEAELGITPPATKAKTR